MKPVLSQAYLKRQHQRLHQSQTKQPQSEPTPHEPPRQSIHPREPHVQNPEIPPEVPTHNPTIKSEQPSYRGWDVHAYTRDIQSQLHSVLPIMTRQTQTNTKPVTDILLEVQAYYSNHLGACTGLANIRKSLAMHDPDLCGVPVDLLFTSTWLSVCGANDPSLYALFGEILGDIGDTCLQGVTHRLFTVWKALQG